MPKCLCIKADGTKCTYNAKPGSKFCGIHKNCKKQSNSSKSGSKPKAKSQSGPKPKAKSQSQQKKELTIKEKYDLYWDLYKANKNVDALNLELYGNPEIEKLWKQTLKKQKKSVPKAYAQWYTNKLKRWWKGELMVDKVQKALQQFYDKSQPLGGDTMDIILYGWDKDKLALDDTLIRDQILDILENN